MGFTCRDTSRGVGTTPRLLILWLFLSLMLITTSLHVLVSSDIFLAFHSLQLMVLMFGGFGSWGGIHLHLARRLTESSFYLIYTRVSSLPVRYFELHKFLPTELIAFLWKCEEVLGDWPQCGGGVNKNPLEVWLLDSVGKLPDHLQAAIGYAISAIGCSISTEA
jgi:hypothetical protein